MPNRRLAAVCALSLATWAAAVRTPPPAVAAEPPATAPATAPAVPTAPARPAVTEPELAEGLAKAAALTPNDVAGFRSALQAVAGGFHVVDVGTTQGTATWNTITLNRLGKRVDAFRFRTPQADKLADLHWAFAYPSKAVSAWYVTPVVGEMTGFSAFHPLGGPALKKLDLPKGHVAVGQHLPAAELKPNTEYLMWFTFPDDKPVEVKLAINFTPGTGKPKADVPKSLGLE